MKIVVINLPAESTRWAGVWDRFHRVGLKPERLKAVHGASLPAHERDALYSKQLNRRQYHKPLQPGEIGCYASHLRVWRQLLRSGDACWAVFEDDVAPDASLPRVLQAIEQQGPVCDMVKLTGRRHETPRSRGPLLHGSELVRYQRVPSFTSGYVIHRRGAERLLAQRVPFGRPLDADLRHWWECGLDIRGVQPYPLQHNPACLPSTIAGRRAPATVQTRLRRLMLQFLYSWRNWYAQSLTPRRADRVLPWAAPARRESPAGHDAA